MTALDRYTGVLYDAIGVEQLTAREREFLGRTVVIHSALFGLVRADDPIPAYRFSHDSRIPKTSLTKIWRDANAAILAADAGLTLDLRSEAYVHLGPASDRAVFLRVVSDDGSGHRRALNHFNKHGKGELVRALAKSGQDFESIGKLIEWAHTAGINLSRGADGELDLVV